MVKKSVKRLALHRETLGRLELALAVGQRLAGTADFETCEGCDSYYDRCPAQPAKAGLAVA